MLLVICVYLVLVISIVVIYETLSPLSIFRDGLVGPPFPKISATIVVSTVIIESMS